MKENYPKKIYYSISEVADILEETPSLIRFWSNKFPTLIKPERNKKGNRQFTAKDVENFKLIYHLVKESGMTLEGAQKRLKENASGEERRYKAIGKLKEIRKLLLKVSNNIDPDDNLDEQLFAAQQPERIEPSSADSDLEDFPMSEV